MRNSICCTINKSKLVYSLLLLAVLVITSQAMAIVPQRLLGEEVRPVDATILSHTKIINSGRLTAEELTKRYWERGKHYASLKQLDQAVMDYNSAINVSRSYAPAYIDRAYANARMEKYKLAFNDLHMAAKIQPNNTYVYATRGAMNFLLGRYKFAVKDFKTYLKLKPKDMYRMLWLYLSEKYQNRSAISAVPEMVKVVDLNDWPGALLRLYIGQVNAEDVIKALSETRMSRGHKCEAYYYLGQYYLLQNNKATALKLFKKAIATRAKAYTEYEFSLAYIEKLKRGAP